MPNSQVRVTTSKAATSAKAKIPGTTGSTRLNAFKRLRGCVGLFFIPRALQRHAFEDRFG